jgi:dUTPase
LPDLKLPFRCCQLIIDRSIHYTMEKVSTVEDLGKSSRGDGGFGSTDKK